MVVVRYEFHNGGGGKEFEVLIFGGILYDKIDAGLAPDEDVEKALKYLESVARDVRPLISLYGIHYGWEFYIPNRKGVAREVSCKLRKILLEVE